MPHEAKTLKIFSTAVSIRRVLTQTLSIVLILSLLSALTPAAPLVLTSIAVDYKNRLAYFKANGWASTLQDVVSGRGKPEAKRQEKQSERDSKVARVAISPGDVILQVGRSVVFVGVAYDRNNMPISGVQFTWHAHNETQHKSANISQVGEFKADTVGGYRVRIDGAGQTAQVRVEVRNYNKAPHEDDDDDATQFGKVLPSVGEPAAADAECLSSDWTDCNNMTATDPGNRIGNPPGAPDDEGVGSGNFQITAPVLSSAGRSLDINLLLHYNSRVWHKAGSEIIFDVNRAWPAPGWTLGFGKVVGTSARSAMIVEADGTMRHHSPSEPPRQFGPASWYYFGRTTDGSNIEYTTLVVKGAAYGCVANHPDGTMITYEARDQLSAGPDGAVYPVQIRDAHGNYISIAYRNNRGPQINTIKDTLGRIIEFHYDSSDLLTAITAPDLSTGSRTLVRLHYRWHSLGYGFNGLTPRIRNLQVPVLDAIYYPATGTGYWFGDADSYSSYGMIAKVVEQREMTFAAASLNEQGTVSPGQVTRQRIYNYTLTPDNTLSDAPTYTELSETWARMDVAGPAVTTYSVHQEAASYVRTLTLPDGTRNVQYSHKAPDQYNDGLVYKDETYASNSLTLLSITTVAWEQGEYGSPRRKRIESTDELNQKTAQEFSYGPYNQVTVESAYGYDGGLLRETKTEYEDSANYINNHLFNLPKVVEAYSGDGTRVSRVEYEYDSAVPADAPDVGMYIRLYNPHNPPGTGYSPSTAYQGNVTSVKRYADAATLSGALTETRQYDITGNLISSSPACCEQTNFTYTSDTQYAYPESQTRGAAAQQSTTHTTYDFNTGLALTTTDANGRTTTNTYYPTALRPKDSIKPTGASTTFAYDDAAMSETLTTYAAGGEVAAHNARRFNGLGKVHRETASAAGFAEDLIDTRYDVLGRASGQTNPYRNRQSPVWRYTEYDPLGRVAATGIEGGREFDNPPTLTTYNEASRPAGASAAPGQTVLTVEPAGRWRWTRSDALGRLVEVVEPNANDSSGIAWATLYSYDTLGNLTEVAQGTQRRRFRYDSLSRLTHQKLAETGATLDAAGRYVGAGGDWSEVFAYDVRSNIISRTDARGVQTTFAYNDDPLNRLQSVAYTIPAVRDVSSPIAPAPTVTYEYMPSGDKTRLHKVTAAGVSTEEYGYDAQGRISEHKLTFAGGEAYPMVTNHLYDTLDRATDVTYPAQYGTGVVNPPRKIAHHNYDVASRVMGLQVDGEDYAANIQYDPANRITEMTVGNGSTQVSETYEYEDRRGLLARQTVRRGGTSLLDLSYGYQSRYDDCYGARCSPVVTPHDNIGQVTRITNNLDSSRSRDYSYDALGRLTQAKSFRFQAGSGKDDPSRLVENWAQTYTYDRYGN